MEDLRRTIRDAPRQLQHVLLSARTRTSTTDSAAQDLLASLCARTLSPHAIGLAATDIVKSATSSIAQKQNSKRKLGKDQDDNNDDDNISGSSNAVLWLNLESDVRFLLNMWEKMGEAVHVAVFKAAAQKHDADDDSNNSPTTLLSVTVDRTTRGKTSSSSILVDYSQQQAASSSTTSLLTTWRRVLQPQLVHEMRKGINNNNNNDDVSKQRKQSFEHEIIEQKSLFLLGGETNSSSSSSVDEGEERNNEFLFRLLLLEHFISSCRGAVAIDNSSSSAEDNVVSNIVCATLCSVALNRGWHLEVATVLARSVFSNINNNKIISDGGEEDVAVKLNSEVAAAKAIAAQLRLVFCFRGCVVASPSRSDVSTSSTTSRRERTLADTSFKFFTLLAHSCTSSPTVLIRVVGRALFGDLVVETKATRHGDSEATVEEDEDEDDKLSLSSMSRFFSDGSSRTLNTVLLIPLKRCALDRCTIDFIIKGLLMFSAPAATTTTTTTSDGQQNNNNNNNNVSEKVWEEVTSIWAHEQRPSAADNDHYHHHEQAATKTTTPLGGSLSSFIHSSSPQTNAALTNEMMALLALAMSDLRHHHHVVTSSSSSKNDDQEKLSSARHVELMNLSTSNILKGISFRLSALNATVKQQGALVATMYFDICDKLLLEKKKASGDDDISKNLQSGGGGGGSGAGVRFEQWPNLMSDYEAGASIWSHLFSTIVTVMNNRKKMQNQKKNENHNIFFFFFFLSCESEIIQALWSSSQQDGGDGEDLHQQKDQAVAGSLNNFWLFALSADEDDDDDDGNNSVVPTAAAEAASSSSSCPSPSDTRRILHPWVADPQNFDMLVNERGVFQNYGKQHSDSTAREMEEYRRQVQRAVAQQQRQRGFAQQQLQRNRGGAMNRAQATNGDRNNGGDDVGDTNAAASSKQKRSSMLHNITLTLREVETKITAGDAGSGGGAPENAADIAQEAVNSLPQLLERGFHTQRQVVEQHEHQNSKSKNIFFLQRSDVADSTVVTRLFLLCIASSTASAKPCERAASESAGWCVAQCPAAVLPQCRSILAGDDFSMTHKLRVLSAIQQGMTHLANSVVVARRGGGGRGEEEKRRNMTTTTKEEEQDNNVKKTSPPTQLMVYPPMMMMSASTTASFPSPNSSEGTVRWKSKKLDKDYQKRHNPAAASTVNNNEALDWAALATETALLLPSNYWITKDDTGHLIIEAIRTVTVISELVAGTSAYAMQRTVATEPALDCLLQVAMGHYLPLVRLNALVCLGSVLRFSVTRRAMFLRAGGATEASSSSLAWGTLFVAGISKLASSDPDMNVRIVASDLFEVCVS